MTRKSKKALSGRKFSIKLNKDLLAQWLKKLLNVATLPRSTRTIICELLRLELNIKQSEQSKTLKKRKMCGCWPWQPIGVNAHYTQHPTREQPLSFQSSKNSKKFPPRRSSVATPPGFHRPTNHHHATQQKEKLHSRHGLHQRLVLIWD
ncbi:hypothetical protein TNCV_3814811 [Trichonephila clavipes]|nr:hypothetical protein TNCV_3814811 [Trichonephila clavipes]